MIYKILGTLIGTLLIAAAFASWSSPYSYGHVLCDAVLVVVGIRFLTNPRP